MNRKNLLSIIVLDILVMVLAAGLIVFRYNSLSETSPSSIHAFARPTASQPEATASSASSAPFHTLVATTEMSSNQAVSAELPRNVVFVFRHSKAKKVEVIGDFNGWVPRPMIKGMDFKWTITLPISSGEYAYNFVVDGKPIRDPNNAKVCDVGRGFPNSLLKVLPRSDERK